jgi:hypothetical protein
MADQSSREQDRPVAEAHNPKLRLGVTLQEASSFNPGLADGPPLPVV